MPYIGIFSEKNIQDAIDKAAEKLGPDKSGLVAHIDTNGNATVSVVKKFGSVISIEAAAVMDISSGFKFDKQHLSAQAELIAEF